MKPLLREFVDWLEEAHFRPGPIGSPFEQPLPPHALKWAETAVELALASDRTVVLFTRNTPSRSVIAGLAFHCAGIQIESVYRGELDDDAFDRLTSWLTRTKATTLAFEEGTPTYKSMTAHLADGKFAFIC